ncbi:hypothetical protein HOG17_01520 [Candidatus Peregrinibacteria bacterium]|jgi:hypothetical protein|nr:hypothetical protein [Candidatus Peregrinibacteria bacterium]MBT4148412.1 hypothetical protein [Candidatus Peregrinibacteria bacterium]MBT4366471.1 hypothetical protein [Candidatus Peregrinibacteria bacterium]MBT4456078.1 hypothetical protein [Candidatus Peregrinibacteria bacterium]
MIKRITTILLTLILATQLLALPVHAVHTTNTTDTHTDTLIADANSNKLIIPKPDPLPGVSTDQQGTPGGVKKWFTEVILPNWTKGIVGFVAMLSLLMLVISGFRYLTSYGNEETAGAAKKMAIYSLVALLLTLFSYTIVSIIVNIEFA